jgi:anti-sigma factor RsiW
VADPGRPAGDPGSADHATHDLELIVALLDRDEPEADHAAARSLIARCATCATVHRDLVAIGRAMAAAPTPTRPRDFTLTPAVAASLVKQAVGEPVPAAARLSHDMATARSRHETHDRLLIANLVDRAVDETERSRAEELLAACRECEQLYDDLVALSAATRAMSVPVRPRDFTLTETDAQRLRIRGWRRLLGAIGSSRDVFSRPLAVGLTTLGLAGLMVATVPSFFLASGATTSGPNLMSTEQAVGDTAAGAPPPEAVQLAPEAPASAGTGSAAAAAPSSAASPPAPEALPQVTDDLGIERVGDDGQVFYGSETSPLPGEPDGRDLFAVNPANDGPLERSTTIVLAAALLVIGLVLFGLRWTARRLGDG